jgi:hypothetical protein
MALENKKMTTFAFVRFLKEAALVPNHLGIEQIEEILAKMVPAVVSKESDFYHKHKVVHIYDKELTSNTFNLCN